MSLWYTRKHLSTLHLRKILLLAGIGLTVTIRTNLISSTISYDISGDIGRCLRSRGPVKYATLVQLQPLQQRAVMAHSRPSFPRVEMTYLRLLILQVNINICRSLRLRLIWNASETEYLMTLTGAEFPGLIITSTPKLFPEQFSC